MLPSRYINRYVAFSKTLTMTIRTFHILLICCICILLLAACGDALLLDDQSINSAQIDFSTNVSAGQSAPLNWSEASVADLWYAVKRSDSLVDVGVTRPGVNRGFENGKVLVPASEQNVSREKLQGYISGRVVSFDDKLATARIRLRSLDDLEILLASPFVDFVEPAYVSHSTGLVHSDGKSGCGATSWTDGLFAVGPDFISNRLSDQIPLAWHHANGSGVTLTFIGTGISKNQPQLNEHFESGLSSERTSLRLTTRGPLHDPHNGPEYWDDDCGHESRLISVATGPRNGTGLAGISYRSHLISIRAISDPLVWTDSEHIIEAIREAVDVAQTPTVVNLAFGSITYKENIARAIEAAVDEIPDQLIFIGAAGTSPSILGQQHIVVFPARMPEVIAVTGINDDGSVCSNCHYGTQVEFGAFTNEPSINPLSRSGHYLADHHVNISGSSGATAVIAGIAALTWSADLTRTNSQVVSRMKNSAAAVQLPNHNSWTTGFGMPNAACAVGGICRIELSGPGVITESGNYTFTAEQVASNTAATYAWSTGHTSPSISLHINTPQEADEHMLLSVTVTDHKGASITRSRMIIIRADSNQPDCPPEVIICPDN